MFKDTDYEWQSHLDDYHHVCSNCKEDVCMEEESDIPCDGIKARDGIDHLTFHGNVTCSDCIRDLCEEEYNALQPE